MDKQVTMQEIKRNLEAIQEWAAEQLAYVEKGAPDYNTPEEMVFYYRYVRSVRCAY
jgi:hypothetical protein